MKPTRTCNAICTNGTRCKRPAARQIVFHGNERGHMLGGVRVQVHVCDEHTPAGVLVQAAEPEGAMRVRL